MRTLLGVLVAGWAAALFAATNEPFSSPFPGHSIPAQDRPISAAEAAKSFIVPDDLEIELVLSEPIVRQPVFLNFDERGRMWVVQYLQYPSPAGLNVVSKDQWWRAVYDKVPEPPPRGARGLDKITIHEDTDGDGLYDKHKTFIDGLNIATACVKGRGGVWVLNPPYLLFYPDRNDDDVPDGPPVVHLAGFGLEDTHSVVNSLRWGPDGWLYAAQGSTVTGNVRVVAPGSADTNRVFYSQGQNIWRYHPEKHIYEVFAEGGGNAFGVEFDDMGRLFSGHNGGDTRGFHYMQGAYLRKGFEKHGELANPYAFGWFPHMDGTKGERFTHNFIIYHGGALPARYDGKLFGIEPLQGRVVLSEITPDGSTFKTRDLERVVTSKDAWFRPVDIKTGPDGAIYIADWSDRQVTHTRNQDGLIDKETGRIYRLKKKGVKAALSMDLRRLSYGALLGNLAHPNPWIRENASRLAGDMLRTVGVTTNQHIVADLKRAFLESARTNTPDMDRYDPGAATPGKTKPTISYRPLTSAEMEATRERALPILWALHVVSRGAWTREGFGEWRPVPTMPAFQSRYTNGVAAFALQHPNPHVRRWACELLGDEGNLTSETKAALLHLAIRETNVEVRAQLACTAKRLPTADALPIVASLARRDADAKDPRIPLLIWWAIESKCASDPDAVVKLFDDSTFWTQPLVEQHLLDRVMQRFAATGARQDLLVCAKLLDLARTPEHRRRLMRGFEEAFKGRSLTGLPDELVATMRRHDVGSPALKLRQGDDATLELALRTLNDPKGNASLQLQFISVLGEAPQAKALPALLDIATRPRATAALRRAALNALLAYNDPTVGTRVTASFAAFNGEVRTAAFTLLASRAPWTLALLRAVEARQLAPADVPRDIVAQMRRHRDDSIATLIDKQWPHARALSEDGEKKFRRYSDLVRNGAADPYSGKKLFLATCSGCHTLFAVGGNAGPDLTAYQRSDVNALLRAVIDPSAEIREGYEAFNVETKDERSLTGFIAARDERLVVLRGLDGQNISLARTNISEMKPSALSLMPEGLLDPLSDQQVRDLFAYLRSTQPLTK